MSNDHDLSYLAKIAKVRDQGAEAFREERSKWACPHPYIDDGTSYSGGIMRAMWMHGWEAEESGENAADRKRLRKLCAAGPRALAWQMFKEGLECSLRTVTCLPFGWGLTKQTGALAVLMFRVAWIYFKLGIKGGGSGPERAAEDRT